MTRKNDISLVAFVALLGALLFFHVWGPGFAIGAGPYWQQPAGDIGSHIAGMRYYLAEPWQWPPFHIEGMGYDAETSLIFTDSVPLAGLFGKLLVSLGMQAFNYLALWFFLSWVLQPVAALYAARGAGLIDRFALASIALLSLAVPAWLARYGHLALCSHFLLLIAIGLYFRTSQHSVLRFIAAWAVLLCATLLVHPYLMVMAFAFFLAAGIERWRSSGLLWRVLGQMLVVVLSLAITMLVAGHLAGSRGMGGFGHFSMNLLSPIWPQNSVFFPSLRGMDATGGQYEGYNYLGLGIILIAASALWYGRGDLKAKIKKHWPLMLALLGLTLVALSNRIYLGDVRLVHLGKVPGILDSFRSSGRFFWSVTYVILILAVTYLVSRAPRRISYAILAIAVILQFVDTGVLRAHLHGVARDGHRSVIDDRMWAELIARHERVRVLPSFWCAESDAQPKIMAMVVESSKSTTPISTSYNARTEGLDCAQEIAYGSGSAAGGELVIFANIAQAAVLLDGETDNCRSLDGLIACSPFWDDLPALTAGFAPVSLTAEELVPDRQVDIGEPEGSSYLVTGWSGREDWGVWSDGAEASIVFSAPTTDPTAALCMRLQAFLPASGVQEVGLHGSDGEVAHWWFDDGAPRECCVAFPRNDAEDAPVWLRFAIFDPTSPDELGLSSDSRKLGIALSSLRLDTEAAADGTCRPVDTP